MGDPLKDTSGPALNILMKLMAIISLVFGSQFAKVHPVKAWNAWLELAKKFILNRDTDSIHFSIHFNVALISNEPSYASTDYR